ncbi:MAG: DUF3592 domain-containing protein [Rhodobacteraceae bacterium]|nr:DUF3592 domain-containing protein [Paracoccaceae bacterium]
MTGRGPLRIDWGVAAGALLFLLVGGGFAIFGGYQLANTRAFLQAAEPVRATVIARHESCDDDGCTWRPTFRFTDAHGEIREAQTLYSASNYGWSEGTERTVLHNPAFPHVRVPGFANLWVFGAGFFLLGALLVVLAIYPLAPLAVSRAPRPDGSPPP